MKTPPHASLGHRASRDVICTGIVVGAAALTERWWRGRRRRRRRRRGAQLKRREGGGGRRREAEGGRRRPRVRLVCEHMRRIVNDEVDLIGHGQGAQRAEVRGVRAEERMHAAAGVMPSVVRRGRVKAAVPPLLPYAPLEERLVMKALHVDVDDPKVREREVLAPRVQAARRLVTHAKLQHIPGRPAARRQQRLVGCAIVVLGEPVGALVAAPLVEEGCDAQGRRSAQRQRCGWWCGGSCRTVEQRAVVRRPPVRIARRGGRALGEVVRGPSEPVRSGKKHAARWRVWCGLGKHQSSFEVETG